MKAKLVIEMPNNCNICKFLVYYEDGDKACCASYFTRCFVDEDYDIFETKRLEWCPLIPVEEEISFEKIAALINL